MSEQTNRQRERLEELLDLAQTYRGWNRKQLAAALGRDASNLTPASGCPKIDLVVGLAGVLDWPLEDVVASFWLHDHGVPDIECPPSNESFDELEGRSRQAHREGSYTEAASLARQAHARADSSEKRAIASTREISALDGLGKYREAMDAGRRGLREPNVSVDRRLILQVNLANEYYTLWHPIEARSMANDIVQWFDQNAATNRIRQVTRAFSFYVRGNGSRRLATIDGVRREDHARAAKEDLVVAQRLFGDLADAYGDESYQGIANTCRGGIIETEVALGILDAEGALTQLSQGLTAVVDLDACSSGDWLESYGWWCIYGCNIALRGLDDQRRVQQHLAVFTNKADEIAERTDNWAMRERIVTMEYARRRHFADWTGVDSDWTIDTDDVRAIAGTMGRFPQFQETGWTVLRTARIIREPERNGLKRSSDACELPG